MTAPATRDEARLLECTGEPIFLFQRRRWVWLGAPEGYRFDEEGDCVPDTGAGFPLTGEGVRGLTFGEFDTPCALETWDTERVYLSREGAEDYGRRRAYNYRDGWRVYCVTASGALASLLQAHALGNAVSPAQAALAFSDLVKRASA